MNIIRKRKIVAISFVLGVLGVVIGLVLYALRQNINLFYTPMQLLSESEQYKRTVRVGGLVVKGSVHRDPQSLLVSFQITDLKKTLRIVYQGILPDLFREGQGIVALGKMTKRGYFKASEVLAKHDENYMPPAIKSALMHNVRREKA